MTGDSDGRAWELAGPDGRALGRLTEDGLDMPWVLCRFEPAEGFAAVSELFAEALSLLEEDEMDASDAAADAPRAA